MEWNEAWNRMNMSCQKLFLVAFSFVSLSYSTARYENVCTLLCNGTHQYSGLETGQVGWTVHAATQLQRAHSYACNYV